MKKTKNWIENSSWKNSIKMMCHMDTVEILRKWQSACIGMWHVYEENGNFCHKTINVEHT